MTYAAFVSGLAGLTVTGVKRTFGAPPQQLAAADLPALWVRLPQGNGEVQAFDGDLGMTRAACEVAICILPALQGMTATSFGAAVTMMDGLTAALDGKHVTLGLTNWAMRVEEEVIGDTAYWVLTATVEGLF